MADFTPTQGRYLAFIRAYTNLHGIPPAEAEIAAALGVSPPSVNQMVKALEKKGLILRKPGTPRSLRILVPEAEIPPWTSREPAATSPPPSRPAAVEASPPANLYVLSVILAAGPFVAKRASKGVSREIEIRGDQTLEALHLAIFEAYDRWDEHLYEFQFGKGPHDPKGTNYGLPDPYEKTKGKFDVRTAKLDDLGLKQDRVFGYWFDFGDDWFHQIRVQRIERAIPTVPYPRVTKRVGQSPPQYDEE